MGIGFISGFYSWLELLFPKWGESRDPYYNLSQNTGTRIRLNLGRYPKKSLHLEFMFLAGVCWKLSANIQASQLLWSSGLLKARL